MKKILLILIAIAPLCAHANHIIPISNTAKIDLSGYIKYENYTDTRQVVALREGEYELYPKDRNFDVLCDDINAVGQSNMSAIQSRFRGEITCPKIWNAKPSAIFEADFFGVGKTINIFRIRHAFARIDWKRISLLCGHTWHPIFIPECSPRTIGFNTGAPIEPFGRQPQMRVTAHWGPVDILFAALTQLETTSFGPDGSSNKYLRNNVIPNLHWQVRAKIKTHLLGAGIDFKRIIPRLITNKNLLRTESLSSIATTIYSALNWDSAALRMKLTYGQNMTDFVMLGGYAVKSLNTETDCRKYTPLHNISFWLDFVLKKSVEPGIFIGITKNLGARREIIQTITDNLGNIESTLYARSPNIDYVMRIAPRLRWYIKPVTIGGEIEYTRAAYGTIGPKGKVYNAHNIGNVRLLMALFYYF